jgi:VCBS repeat protein
MPAGDGAVTVRRDYRMRPAAATPLLCLGLLLLAPLTTSSDVTAPVSAAGRGGPWINFRDGVPVVVEGTHAAMLSPAAQGRPLGLATGDFDGDGVPDLVSAYGDAGGGMVVVHRGNVDAVYPGSAQARRRKAQGRFTDQPFLTARSFPLPVAPDFVGSGDFDADGHLDVVIARRGGRALFWLPGDGRGGFRRAQRVDLPGAITALATGEINLRDGLTDVVIGIAGAQGAQALVFESPDGAFQGVPEALPLPTAASALAIGPVHGGAFGDLVIAAGRNLIIADGRDRQRDIEDAVPIAAQARLTQRRLARPIAAIALGNFADDGRTQIAVLLRDGAVQVLGRPEGRSMDMSAWPASSDAGQLRGPAAAGTRMIAAKVSSRGGHDLVVADPSSAAIEILSPSTRTGARLGVRGAPVAVLAMQLNADAQSDLVVLAEGQAGTSVVMSVPVNIFTVTHNGDSGMGSLRQAILDANASPGADAINFGTSGPIVPLSPLPRITEAVTIDGTTAFTDGDRVELRGSSAGAEADGLVLGGGGSAVRGLVINRFSGVGIRVASNTNVIDGNLIGTDVLGTSDLGNGQGIRISNVTGNLVGGTTAAARNVISGNKVGVVVAGSVASGNLIQGNYIGTDITGTADVGNATGIRINGARGHTIGGTAAGSRNVISGNSSGVDISGAGATGNLVQGNFVGTDATGSADLGNGIGILIGAPDNRVGGTTVTARNVISANSDGVSIRGAEAKGNLVQGNFVGTDATGSAALGNGSAIAINNAPGNTVGGTRANARNVISGNAIGVDIVAGATGNLVQGNFVGTDATGAADLGNGIGIFISAPDNRVGGTTVTARNVISGNSDGVLISGAEATGNRVQGNFIGLNPAGTAAAGNLRTGVLIDSRASANRIGGTTAGAGNVISGNGRNGVRIADSSTTGNRVEGNRIGTNAAGTAAVANLNSGVRIDTPSNFIGGTAAGAGNQISGNAQHGVIIDGIEATGNRVEGNRIGTNAAGTAALPNTQDGVRISALASQNAIGGEAAAANTIAFNGGIGVTVMDATSLNNTIRRNAIFSNGGLGIDLGVDGVTSNDAGDPDPGPNNLQNFPVVTLARNEATGTRIRGTLNSTASTQFTLDFFASPACDVTTHGQGQRYLRSGAVITNSSGDGTFNVVASPAAAVGEQITATATGPASGTSEFSQCLPVTEP